MEQPLQTLKQIVVEKESSHKSNQLSSQAEIPPQNYLQHCVAKVVMVWRGERVRKQEDYEQNHQSADWRRNTSRVSC